MAKGSSTELVNVREPPGVAAELCHARRASLVSRISPICDTVTYGESIAEIADFICRQESDVRAKASVGLLVSSRPIGRAAIQKQKLRDWPHHVVLVVPEKALVRA
jgi:hypothetical protein